MIKIQIFDSANQRCYQNIRSQQNGFLLLFQVFLNFK